MKISFLFRKFDLKGSTIEREASDKELDKQLPTLKDNDFIKQGVKVKIGFEKKEKLIRILSDDCEVMYFDRSNEAFFNCFNLKFLTKLHLMDYSLLIGIHDCQAEDNAEGGNRSDGNKSDEYRSDDDEM